MKLRERFLLRGNKITIDPADLASTRLFHRTRYYSNLAHRSARLVVRMCDPAAFDHVRLAQRCDSRDRGAVAGCKCQLITKLSPIYS
jgi:hypothetical protein